MADFVISTRAALRRLATLIKGKADLVDGTVPLAQIPDITSEKVTDFVEAAQDAIAMLLAEGANVSLTYNDATNSLQITSAGGEGGGASFDAEAVRDAIGITLAGVGVISVVANDEGNVVTISSTATVNSTDASLRDRETHTGTQEASTISDFTEATKTVVESLGGGLDGLVAGPGISIVPGEDGVREISATSSSTYSTGGSPAQLAAGGN